MKKERKHTLCLRHVGDVSQAPARRPPDGGGGGAGGRSSYYAHR